MKKVHLIGTFIYNETKDVRADGNDQKIISKKEQGLLKRNPYAKAVSEKAITYTDEFKGHFNAENEEAK